MAVNAHGFSFVQWEEAKRQAKSILISRAKIRGMIPYSELVGQITAIRFEPHEERFWALLRDISAEEDSEGRGMLTVIVVHKNGDMQPGPGFFDLAEALGRDTSDILACWVEEFKQVHAYWGRR